MSVLQRYFTSEIMRAVGFVMAALLVLTSFFDLMKEVPSVGENGYQITHALLVVLLGMPGNIYDFIPIAVLIGTIYVLAQFATNSEFTIMRAASMSPLRAAMMLIGIACIFVLMTFVVGEVITPMSAKLAKKVKQNASSAVFAASHRSDFRGGQWTKDVIRVDGVDGAIIGTRFLNISEVLPDRSLQGIKIYEFDRDFQLLREMKAQRAEYVRYHVWQLSEVVETRFPKDFLRAQTLSANTQKLAHKDLVSEITPDILTVLLVDPDRMSAYELASYTKHLTENKQATAVYEMAFWKKLTYPISILVMMALALPFAYLHSRDGGISRRIFYGIMLGMSFYLVNSLFSHLGLINTWPLLMTALFPSLLFGLVALFFVRYVQRH
ncbi:MAG: LPS export ABC transporter permease LptG [Undibacterium sp.]|nr:LPS export ABC transporter permease LptG [Undibacterium sp.]